jgi:ATP-dependent Clp protease protease subunit
MGAGYRINARAAAGAEIYIYEEVGQSWDGGVTAKQVADDLKAIGRVSRIDLRINSLGGDVSEGLAIYRLLVENGARIVAHVDGWAASIASVIAMAGAEINIAESGAIMIHEAMGMGYGFADDFRRRADVLDQMTAAIADVYVARTNNTAEAIRQWMKAETWFRGQDAVDVGFATGLMENFRAAAIAAAPPRRACDPAKLPFRIPSLESGASALRSEISRRTAALARARAQSIRSA